MNKKPQTTTKIHPWRQPSPWLKLKASRAEYKRRYERGETKNGDKHKEMQRERYRINHGIHPERPLMTVEEKAAHMLACKAAKKAAKIRESNAILDNADDPTSQHMEPQD